MLEEKRKYLIGKKVYFEGNLEGKGYVVKGKIVSRISKDYQSYTMKLNLEDEFGDLSEDEGFYSNDSLNIKRMMWFVKYIHMVIERLSKDNKEIIINEFINPKENWWQKKYKRSTYFRYRLEAVNEFLDYVF